MTEFLRTIHSQGVVCGETINSNNELFSRFIKTDRDAISSEWINKNIDCRTPWQLYMICEKFFRYTGYEENRTDFLNILYDIAENYGKLFDEKIALSFSIDYWYRYNVFYIGLGQANTLVTHDRDKWILVQVMTRTNGQVRITSYDHKTDRTRYIYGDRKKTSKSVIRLLDKALTK